MQKHRLKSPDNIIGITSTPSKAPISRAFVLLPAGLAFVLYFVTLSPTINFTDSGELVTVAWTEGIAHPPGYPLYTILGSLFAHLPLGNPAWRLNLLSAFFAAISVGLFYRLIVDTLTNVFHIERSLVPRTGYSQNTISSNTRTSVTKTGKPARQSPSKERTRENSGRTASTQLTPFQSSQSQGHVSEVSRIDWTAVAGGIAGSGLLAVSLTFWNWATQAKFYSLHYLFVAAILWLALLARREAILAKSAPIDVPRLKPGLWPRSLLLLHWLAFTIGLSLTNHYLTFLLLPGVAILLLTPFRYAGNMLRLIGRHVGTLLPAFMLPLLLYLYLPLRAAANPLISWGQPDTLSNFWRHITAQSYQGFFSTADLGNHVVDALVYAANQFGPFMGLILLVPVALGIKYLWQTDHGLLSAGLCIALLDLIIVLNYNIREIVTYYVPLYMVVLWWAGLGVAQGLLWLQGKLFMPGTEIDTPTPQVTSAHVSRNFVALAAIGAIIPLLALVLNWGSAGHRDNYTAELFVRNAFKNFQPNAVVITNYWDLTSASFYLQHVLGERPDVTVIDKSLLRSPFYLDYLERNYPQVVSKNAVSFASYKALLLQWIDSGKVPARLSASYINVLTGFIDNNLGQRPVYTEFIADSNDATELQEVRSIYSGYQNQLVPNSFGYRIAPNTGVEELRAQDPQLDLRGVTASRVPLDEIEASVIALYPPSLSVLGTYMQKSTVQADREVGAKLVAQAQELQPLFALRDARPRLR